MDHLVVKVLLILYVLVVIFTYPLTINPTNNIWEAYTINKLLPRKGLCRKWTKNFSRVFVCLLAAYLGIELSEYLDRFLGLLGSLLCAPLAMIIPTYCHLKLVARSPKDKLVDLVIIALSCLIMVFCVVQTI